MPYPAVEACETGFILAQAYMFCHTQVSTVRLLFASCLRLLKRLCLLVHIVELHCPCSLSGISRCKENDWP